MDSSIHLYRYKPEVMKILITAGTNVDVIDRERNTILWYAFRDKRKDVIRLILDAGFNMNNEDAAVVLRTASQKPGYEDIIELILEARANMNVRDNAKEEALIKASLYGRTEVVELLLDAGAEVNAKIKFEEKALMCASMEGHTEIVELLIDAGADVNAKGNKDRTPLIYAAMGGHTEVARILIDAGADIHAYTSNQYSAMDYALGIAEDCIYPYDDIIELLIRKDPSLASQRCMRRERSD